jgi:4-hydroxy-2-oxoheptanedioate aldolase
LEQPKELLRNGVKDKLARDEVVLSMAVRLTRTVDFASMARTAGFDSIYVDMEHSTLSLDATGQICMASLALGITPFVRVANISPETISGVLDAGALGIIAPHVQSAADAAGIVKAAKFFPQGNRSFAGAMPQLQYRSLPTAQACEAVNDATMVIVMIESLKALEAVEEIAAVDGVDMLFIGTNDLCSSLGIPGQLDHELIRKAYSRCMAACRKQGKHLGVGGLASNPGLAAELVKLGARYVSVATDISFLISAATARVKQLRGSL